MSSLCGLKTFNLHVATSGSSRSFSREAFYLPWKSHDPRLEIALFTYRNNSIKKSKKKKFVPSIKAQNESKLNVELKIIDLVAWYYYLRDWMICRLGTRRFRLPNSGNVLSTSALHKCLHGLSGKLCAVRAARFILAIYDKINVSSRSFHCRSSSRFTSSCRARFKETKYKSILHPVGYLNERSHDGKTFRHRYRVKQIVPLSHAFTNKHPLIRGSFAQYRFRS